MSDIGWLVVALASVAIGIGGYLLILTTRLRKVRRRLSEIENEGI